MFIKVFIERGGGGGGDESLNSYSIYDAILISCLI